MAIDHVTLDVQDIAASRKFYAAALRPLGYEARAESGESVGFGDSRGVDFWVARRGDPRRPRRALRASGTGRQFHEAAYGRGGGTTASRAAPQYHETTTPRTSTDPDGNNIEAVSHSGSEPGRSLLMVGRAGDGLPALNDGLTSTLRSPDPGSPGYRSVSQADGKRCAHDSKRIVPARRLHDRKGHVRHGLGYTKDPQGFRGTGQNVRRSEPGGAERIARW